MSYCRHCSNRKGLAKLFFINLEAGHKEKSKEEAEGRVIGPFTSYYWIPALRFKNKIKKCRHCIITFIPIVSYKSMLFMLIIREYGIRKFYSIRP